MKITFDEIPEEGTLNVEFSEEGDALNILFKKGLEGDFHFDSPVMASFGISKREETVFVEFDIVGALKLSCSRCLAEFEYPIKTSDRLILFPFSEETGEEEALDEDEVGKLFYLHEMIDLDGIVREEIALQLPPKPLCRETCKGLCQKCGQDLNEEDCGCSEEIVDSRLEVLKDIKFE